MAQAPQPPSAPIGSLVRAVLQEKLTENSGTEGTPSGHGPSLPLRQDVPNLGAESGVSGRTRLLPGTLAHALVVFHNALPTGHETHPGEYVCP